MKGTCELVTWFSEREPAMLPDSCVVVGGTQLLAYFLRGVADRTSLGATGYLGLAAPFIGAGLRDHLAALPHVGHGRIDLVIVTAGRRDAQRCVEEFGGFPWRSLQINVRSRLHAKIFSFNESTGGGLCLVGSHNLTQAGVTANEEAGVLFAGSSSSSTAAVIHACHDTIIRIAQKGARFSDSLALDDQAA
jgi:hypothetical protein